MSLLRFLQSSLHDAGLLPAGSVRPVRSAGPRSRRLQVESLERRAVLTVDAMLTPIALAAPPELPPPAMPIAPLESMPGSEQYPLPETGSPMGPLPAASLPAESLSAGSTSAWSYPDMSPEANSFESTAMPAEESSSDTTQATAEAEDDGGVIVYDETVGTAPRIEDFHMVTIGEWFWFEGIVLDDDFVEGLSVNFTGSLGDFNATVNADGTFQTHPFHISQQGSVKAYTIDWYGNYSNEVFLAF